MFTAFYLEWLNEEAISDIWVLWMGEQSVKMDLKGIVCEGVNGIYMAQDKNSGGFL
jgi:hypothetical protein